MISKAFYNNIIKCINLLNGRPVYLSHQSKKKKFFKINDGVEEQKQLTVYPHQYPKHSLTDTTPIISRGRPIRFMSPKYQVPEQNMIDSNDLINQKIYGGKWKSPPNSYNLNIGMIGPVNAGKSQLFGALSHPISAVSPKAATTTQIIHGIKSFEKETEQGLRNVQLKYFDTPGLMYKKQGFLSRGWKVLSQIDFTLLVVDSAKRFDNMIKQSIIRLQKHREYPNFMKALVLNKIDLVDNRRKLESLIRQIQQYGKFDKIFYTSAKTGYGIQELQNYLIGMAKQGEWEHPSQVKTTMTQLQVMEEMLREGLFQRLYKQVPHNSDVTCTSFLNKSDGTCQALFDVFVMSQNQQRMVIGKKGLNIEQAIKRFKVLFAKYYQKEVQVHVSIKIKDDFRKKYPGRQQIIISDQGRQDRQKLKQIEDYIDQKKANKFLKM